MVLNRSVRVHLAVDTVVTQGTIWIDRNVLHRS